MNQLKLFYLGINYDGLERDFYFHAMQNTPCKMKRFVWYTSDCKDHYSLSDRSLDRLVNKDYYVGEVWMGEE